MSTWLAVVSTFEAVLWIGHCLRKRIQDSSTWLLAGDRFVLKEGAIWFLFERGVEGADWDNKPGGFLCCCQHQLLAPKSVFFLTMRVLGIQFQLSRIPSRSSTSLHWSLRASKSIFNINPVFSSVRDGNRRRARIEKRAAVCFAFFEVV